MASIIDPKYKDKYKGEKDWLTRLLDANVVKADTKLVPKKNEDGSPSGETETITLKSTSIDLEALFAVAEANGLDIAKYRTQVGSSGAPGRLRMTVGNMLRAAAKKRHGLFVPNAEAEGGKIWSEADAAFIGENAKTQNPDGSKIVVAKPAAEAAAPADAAAPAEEAAA